MICKIKYEDEAKNRLAEGILSLCKVLKLTGRVLADGQFSMSAREIAKKIEGDDPWVNQGIRLMSSAVSEINQETGCGTAETSKYTECLLREAQIIYASGDSPVVFAKQLRKASEIIENYIKEHAVLVNETKLELLNAILDDEEEAKIIQQACEKGKPIVKESVYARSYLEVTDGMKIEQPLSIGDEALLQDAYVLVTDKIFTKFNDLLPLLEKIEAKPLFMVVENIDGEAKELLKTNVAQGRIKVWVVKAPGYGQRKIDIMTDLSLLTGTTVKHELFPDDIKNLDIGTLGKARKIQVTKNTCIVSDSGKKQDKEKVKQRIKTIMDKLDHEKVNYYDQQKLRERIAWLSGCAPVIYAGGESLTESKNKKRTLEYALAYAQNIEQYGMITNKDFEQLWTKQNYLVQDKTMEKTWRILEKAINESCKEVMMSAGLLCMVVRKMTDVVCMWLATGACMVGVAYDKEDLELIKNGVDVERLRSSI